VSESGAASARAGEARALLSIAWPVMFTQLLQMGLGVVDLLMLGRAGVDAMAAATLATSYAFPSMMAGVGVVYGIDPLISQAHGAGDRQGMALALQRGILIALAVSVPIMFFWYHAQAALLLLGQEPGLARAAGAYLRVHFWSAPLFLLFMTLRQYLQGRAIVLPGLLALLLLNLLNALFDWVLIFGKLGMPALGLYGAGIASGLTHASGLLLLLGLIVVGRLHDGAWQPWGRQSFEPAGLARVLRLGLPIGLQWGLEVLAFGGTAMMAGWISAHAVSAHSIVLNVASFTFMLPLGLAIAVATRVGNAIGEGAQDVARRAAKLALLLAVAVMACCGLALVGLRNVLPLAWTDDATVIALAASLLPIAAAFQIFDGAQVVSGGILRGIGRTRAPAVSHFVGYYVVGLPVGYLLAFRAGLGVAGLWWGLLIGLGALALTVTSWSLYALRKPLVRVA
jgi:multidrug resistance protein, MATE family